MSTAPAIMRAIAELGLSPQLARRLKPTAITDRISTASSSVISPPPTIRHPGAGLSNRMGRKGSGVQEDARAQLGLARLRCVAISVSVLARADA